MSWREDKTLIVLCGFSIFYTLVLLLIIWWKPNDASIWQLFSGILTGFIGALGLHLKGERVSPPGTTTATTTATITEVPQEDGKRAG